MITPETLTSEMVESLLDDGLDPNHAEDRYLARHIATWKRWTYNDWKRSAQPFVDASRVICEALNAREAAHAPSTLAQACIQLGMTLSEEERAGFRAYADNAPPAGSTLARLRAEEAWEQGDGDVPRVAPESRSGVVADVEALRAQARKP